MQCLLFWRTIRSWLGGGASTPIGHWRSSSKTGTPNIYFGVTLFEQQLTRWLKLWAWPAEKGVPDGFCLTSNMRKIHFRPRLRHGSRWESLQCSPEPLVGWGGDTPSPHHSCFGASTYFWRNRSEFLPPPLVLISVISSMQWRMQKFKMAGGRRRRRWDRVVAPKASRVWGLDRGCFSPVRVRSGEGVYLFLWERIWGGAVPPLHKFV